MKTGCSLLRASLWARLARNGLVLYGGAVVLVVAVTSVLNLDTSVAFLPAASLLAARVPPRPFALLVGLNIGPNLLVTGSPPGPPPSVAKASRLGLAAVPPSMAAALGMLTSTGSH